MKKERLSVFKKTLKENDGVATKKFLAIVEMEMGISRDTALHYLEIFRDIDFVDNNKGILKIKGK